MVRILPALPLALSLLMAAAVPMSAPAAAASAEPLSRQAVSVLQAETMIDGAVAEAKSRGIEVSIVVVDSHGAIVAAHRMDGSGPAYFEIARRKALTSAVFRAPSSTIENNVVNGLQGSGSFWGAMVLDDIMPRQGALPLKAGAETIGAIGVSGATPDVDELIAQAGIDALTQG